MVFRRTKSQLALFADRQTVNMYYPFELVDSEPGNRKWVMLLRPQSFRHSVVAAVLSLAACCICIATKASDTEYFVFALGFFVVAVIAVVNYNIEELYGLHEKDGTYTYQIGEKSIKGQLHNVYIRLKQRLEAGKPMFYIILGGANINPVVLPGKSRNVYEARTLGQRIAMLLNLNYFDIKNVSTYHAIRHWPRKESDGADIAPLASPLLFATSPAPRLGRRSLANTQSRGARSNPGLNSPRRISSPAFTGSALRSTQQSAGGGIQVGRQGPARGRPRAAS